MGDGALTVGTGNVNGLEVLVRHAVVLVQLQHVVESGLVSVLSLAFVVGREVEKPVTGFCVSHFMYYLVEVVFEALEDGLLRLLVALEVVAVLESLHGFLLIAAQRLGNVHADVDHQVALAAAVALYHGQSLAT